jgi:trans-aconitate methyltransferase
MYKWDPADYRRSSAAQQKWARELIEKLALKGNERVLDIGCGDGKMTAEIAAQLPHGSVLGIDSSEEMVAFARRSFPPENFPNLAFAVVDARRLSFDGEFDVVFSNAALHWVIDHLPVLEGVKRSLKPGGKVLLQMGGRGNAAQVFESVEEIVRSEKWREYFQDFAFPYGFYGPEEYRGWLEEAGLEPKRVELIPKDMVHKDREGLAGWLRTTWLPYTQRVQEERREEFISEVVDEYLRNNPPDAGGFIHVRMVRLEVEATR